MGSARVRRIKAQMNDARVWRRKRCPDVTGMRHVQCRLCMGFAFPERDRAAMVAANLRLVSHTTANMEKQQNDIRFTLSRGAYQNRMTE